MKTETELVTYLRKLTHACATLVAFEARAHVSPDDLEYAYLFMKNHLAVLRKDLEDLLEN